MASTVKLTLTSIDGLDSIPERIILLHPDKPVPIGRSSKNPDKGLMASSSNALIDSPVISREHAVFSTSADMNAPNVFVTDDKSRQGTYLNGSEVRRGMPCKLANMDTLCFGQNVIRDMDSFTAQRYRVNFRFPTPEPDRPFPCGINVPDPLTSDEEDMDCDEPFGSSPYPPSYGSRANPVNLDEFEDAGAMPRQPPHLEQEEEEDLDQVYEPPPANPVGEPMAPTASDNPAPLSFDMGSSDDDEDGEEETGDGEDIDYPDEDDDGLSAAGSSDAGFDSNDEEGAGGSDNDSTASNSDVSDHSRPGEEVDAACRVKFGVVLDHEHAKVATPVPLPIATSHSLPCAILSKPQSPTPLQAYTSHLTPSDDFAYEVDKDKMMNNPKGVTDQYFNGWDIGATVQRPPASKTMGWSGVDYNNPVMMRDAPTQNPWFAEQSGSLISANVYSRPTYVATPPNVSSYDHGLPMQFSVTKDADTCPSEPPHVSDNLAKQFQHPAGLSTPPTRVLDTLDETTNQPAPRTKVSIAEIVDDNPQGPMTPTSVAASPSRKRKVDVLDAEEEVHLQDVSPPLNGCVEQTTAAAASSVTEAPSVEPPTKKARSTFSLVASGMAAGFVLGGAVVISALASIDIA